MSDERPVPPAIYTASDGDLFGDLSGEQRAAIERRVSYADYPAGHLFYAPEDEDDAIYILRRGRIRIYKLSLEGRALTLLILEPPAVFGEMALSEHWKHDSFAESLTECEVGMLHRPALRSILAAHPPVAMRFMAIMSDRLRAMERKLTDIAFKSVPQRLATVLLSLAHPDGRNGLPVLLRYTHQQLAEMIGSYRETVTKTIGEFREAGLIRVEGDTILLTDEVRLRAMLG